MLPNRVTPGFACTLGAVVCACGGQILAPSDGGTFGVDAGAADAGEPPEIGADATVGPDASDAGASLDEGGAAPPASCRTSGAGLTDCGASRETCCASLKVTGGTYYRTYTNSGGAPTGEADPATVSSFRLDKYLVTVGRFRQFVNAWNGGAGYTPPPGSGKHTHLNGGRGLEVAGGGYEPGWVPSDDASIAATDASLLCSGGYSTWTSTAGGQETLPMNCVSWAAAYAFCIWDGGFLPSEAEGNYAAAGGAEQRQYPWGTAAPGSGNRYAIYSCDFPGGTGSCDGVTNIAPVGIATLGAGRWGQLDLAGDIWEWNLDAYADPYVAPCADCANLTAGQYRRVIRGGDFASDMSILLASSRYPGLHTTGNDSTVGFRCARAP
ncbi:MAG TPA: SUMF1/EgtB/PvdO family nonheme iron enzyme [Polyangiaceae bacterium]|jgi:formylglycine-generating enzyme required for sulfatase activity|nr:SUMF1/EgtB/PvdO family nonheme iron enzyme [Polyangiaceae bacterium]